MKPNDRLYFVVYDIGEPKRWRAIYRTMQGYGDWVQLSVFQCRLADTRHAELVADLDRLIHHREDHVLVINVGRAEGVRPKVVSLGKRPYTPVANEAIVV